MTSAGRRPSFMEGFPFFFLILFQRKTRRRRELLLWAQTALKEGSQSSKGGLWVFEALVASCFQSSLGGCELGTFFLLHNSV